MPAEIEAKLAVPSHDAVRAVLLRHSAKHIGQVIETNSIYDRFAQGAPSGTAEGQLGRAGAALRVRSVEVLEGAAQPATITFKGPVEVSQFKKREELEIPLADADGMRRLLAAVGFVEVLCFRKRRESWRFQDCRVELDELPRLGCFIEIEGPNENAIQTIRTALGLDGASLVRESYVALVTEAFSDKLASGRTIDFDSD